MSFLLNEVCLVLSASLSGKDEPWSLVFEEDILIKVFSFPPRNLKWKIKNRLTNYRLMNVSEELVLKGTQL